MIRRYVVAAAFFGITACATSSPQAPEPVANDSDPVKNSDSTKDSAELEVIEVPGVPEMTISKNNESPYDRICRYERETGSHMQVRICRTRAQIEASCKSGQEAVRAMGVPNAVSSPPDY